MKYSDNNHNSIYRTGHFSLANALILTIFIALPTSAHAIDFHFGFGLGPAKVEENLGFNDGSLYDIDYDEKTWALTVFGEAEFNRFVRMEFGILDGGLATVDAISDGSGPLWWLGPVEVEYGLGGIKVGAVASIPLAPNDKVKLLLKGGLIGWGSVVTLSTNWLGEDYDNDVGVDPYYGIGLEFDLTRLMALRLQHEAFSVDADSDVFIGGYEFDYTNTTLGLVFRF